jgi:putative endonuclease
MIAPVPSGASPFLEHVVYILLSPHSSRTYVGVTSDLVNRMKSHNTFSKKRFTTRFRPWKVIHVEFFHSKSDALVREAFLKTGVGREWIQKLLITSI